MGLDLKQKNGQWVDKYGLMLGQNRPWDPNGDRGMGDCIGTTVDAYFAYKYDGFIDGIKKCYVDRGDHIEGYRHPSLRDVEPNTMSRDHIVYTLLVMKYAKEDEFLSKLANGLKWRISDKYSFTPDLWLYMKGIAGNRLALSAYYMISIPWTMISISLNKVIYKVCGIDKEVTQKMWEANRSVIQKKVKGLAKWKQKLLKAKYPMYTIYQQAFMLKVLPNTFANRILRKILLWGTDRQNLLTRVVLGDRVNSRAIYGYKAMMGGRWTTYLNELNDRDVYVIPDNELPKNNVLDVDLLRGMYERRRRSA